MTFTVDIQQISHHPGTPDYATLQHWVDETLSSYLDNAELCIRIVDKDESQQLNAHYRGIDRPTNVLSFPYKLPPAVRLDAPLLGDLVLCASIIAQEAQLRQKTIEAHWAHMVVHGLLHLLGYDHQSDVEASIMEEKEIEILEKLGAPHPYQEDDSDER